MKQETLAAIYGGSLVLSMYFFYKGDLLSSEAKNKVQSIQLKYDALLLKYEKLARSNLTNNVFYDQSLTLELENLKMEVQKSSAELKKVNNDLISAKNNYNLLKVNYESEQISIKNKLSYKYSELSNLDQTLSSKVQELNEIKERLRVIRLDPSYVIYQERDNLLIKKQHLEQQLMSLEKTRNKELLDLQVEINKLLAGLQEKERVLKITENNLNKALNDSITLQKNFKSLENNHKILNEQYNNLSTQYNDRFSVPKLSELAADQKIQLLEGKNQAQTNELKLVYKNLKELQEKYNKDTQNFNAKINTLQRNNTENSAELMSVQKELDGLYITYVKDKDRLEEIIRLLRNKLTIKREEERTIPVAIPVPKSKM